MGRRRGNLPTHLRPLPWARPSKCSTAASTSCNRPRLARLGSSSSSSTAAAAAAASPPPARRRQRRGGREGWRATGRTTPAADSPGPTTRQRWENGAGGREGGGSKEEERASEQASGPPLSPCPSLPANAKHQASRCLEAWPLPARRLQELVAWWLGGGRGAMSRACGQSAFGATHRAGHRRRKEGITRRIRASVRRVRLRSASEGHFSKI